MLCGVHVNIFQFQLSMHGTDLLLTLSLAVICSLKLTCKILYILSHLYTLVNGCGVIVHERRRQTSVQTTFATRDQRSVTIKVHITEPDSELFTRP